VPTAHSVLTLPRLTHSRASSFVPFFHQLKEITNRRTQSSEAFETHASWLNNLQQEIGRFSHDAAAVASSARLAAKGSGMAGKVHASVTASTQAGTDTETVQI